jgi:hypothetical protein
MKKTILMTAFLAVPGMLLPFSSRAGDVASTIGGMQPVLDKVYAEMIPLCGKLIGVAQGLAGFGALWYIASRVWKSIAAAEPVDFYPLLRPFVSVWRLWLLIRW